MHKAIRAIPFLVIAAALSTGCSAGHEDANAGSLGSSTSQAEESAATKGPTDGSTRLASQTQNPLNANDAAQARRAVIRNGSLSVRVPDVEKAEKEVGRYVAGAGGYVETTESSDLSSSAPIMSIRLRVPVSRFDSAMEKFESLGQRLEKKVSGEDVTAKLVDFDARLKIMLAQESSFRNMLSKSSDSQQSLDLQTRLMQLRGEIESLSAQRKTLGELAALSTIELRLVSETRSLASTTDEGWVKESWNQASAAFGTAIRVVGTCVLFVAVFSPFWAPFAYLIWRRSRRKPPMPGFEV